MRGCQQSGGCLSKNCANYFKLATMSTIVVVLTRVYALLAAGYGMHWGSALRRGVAGAKDADSSAVASALQLEFTCWVLVGIALVVLCAGEIYRAVSTGKKTLQL